MAAIEDDLAKLPSIDDTIVLETLRARHEHDLIYTKNGAVLVAINPYKDVGVSAQEHLGRYKSSMALEREPPHIFAVAATTHRALISEGCNQAVVISGESGAGKTESARYILQYLRYVSNASHELEERVTKSQPITEAFGCAKTMRNDNRCARARRPLAARTTARRAPKSKRLLELGFPNPHAKAFPRPPPPPCALSTAPPPRCPQLALWQVFEAVL